MGSIVQELQHINAFLYAQLGVLGAESRSATLAAQTTAVSARIANVHAFDAALATQLTELVATGPWTPQQRELIAGAIASRLQSPSVMTTPRGPTQSCMTFPRYLTQDDIDGARGTNISVVVQMVVSRCAAIGLVRPSERTMRVIVGALVFELLPEIKDDYASVYNVVHLFKQLLKKRVKDLR
jgi:hypothetical protein